MNNKFELTSETKIFLGKTLYRIKALISFGEVEKNELGGFVEKEGNLNVSGNSWVSGNALVSGNARVSGDAMAYGNAWVSGNALVSGNARVSGDAMVSGNARVYGNARVSGNAMVYGDARVYGDALKTPLHVSGLQYGVTITDKHIKIGCEFHSTDDWSDFNEKRILQMDGKSALKFWKTNKSIIITLAENHQAES